MPQKNKSKISCGALQDPGPESGDSSQAQAEPRSAPTSGDPAEKTENDLEDLQIIKSPSDPKKYRYIELSNGLRALLISDQSQEACKCRAGQLDDIRESDSEEEEDDSEVDDEEDDRSEQESDNSNEVRKKTKKGMSEKQSAAALCISVGSFSDPEDLPGLAHFLEHMVFMGSEKYPAENGFDAFLKKHGGSDNASTDLERTIFQFDIQRKWAQFFICPLMIEDAIEREVEAVDSEYQLARPSDSHRKEMLFGSLAKPKHPMSKFCWGNAQTLKHDPKEKMINTYDRLREFWRRYYTAHYMTLAVQSRDTLDTLEEWVREIFVKIPNNGQTRPDFSTLQDPFATPDFNKLYKVVPVKKIHALTISWALPPQGLHYRVKPLHYLSWLVGHEGAGSILSVLRKKCWALALFGGNSETGFDQNTTIYEEIQKIEANEFRYQEQTDPIDFTVKICENMQLFPKEDFLCGDQLLFEYNPEVISHALALLTPERANLLLLSPEHEGQCPLKEKWFGTQYSVEDISMEWSELWSTDFSLNTALHLPAENKFIATDFMLKTSDCPDAEFPVKIVDNSQGRLWFKKDTKFKIPKGYIRFNLITPLIQESPENLVLFDLFVNILAHNLAEPAYDADVAQLEYKLVPGDHGLVIRLKGFNHKLPLLLNLIVDYLADFTAALDVFSMFVEQLKKTYFNILIKPDRLGKDVRLHILEASRWSVIQKYQVINRNLTVEDLMEFVTKFKAEMFVEGLVQGNFTSNESKEFLQYFVKRLQFQPLSSESPVLFRVVDLPPKHHLCKVQSLNKGDANSEVTVYYQSGIKSLREHALMELLVMHMEEPCFDFLRTKETLGYQVYPFCRNTSSILGFSVTVETQATKFSTDFVENKIEEFLVNFGEKMTNLSDEAFQAQVTALIKLKECEDTHLGEEVDRNWFEVVTQQYLFNRLGKEILALKQMAKADLVSWYMQHRGADSKKLSVHVVGFGKEEQDHEDNQTSLQKSEDSTDKCSSYGEVSKLTFLPASSFLAGAFMITDIRAFTSSLTLHPYHKILD
ncbi:Nardilysin [Bagarius yarrelli]|uniref:Nardilysin n=1 Tax=Bagarius yarrelli TaxID=175774 RepID=A0A556TS87_BAGYA|nr:Nardilysin [Bagarius yarrelli]